MSGLIGGFDIGGTKCAVVLGSAQGDTVNLMDKSTFPTPDSPQDTLRRLNEELERLLEKQRDSRLAAVGISCGGPLDSAQGVILSPPNLMNWDRIDVVQPTADRFHVPVALQNDANACALAEWRWGAGKGARNMIFLTFGTGMGAGLILNGQLYSGTTDMAGEVGHIRLENDGPVGHGKSGSFEGYCSGGGIALLARSMAEAWRASGKSSSFCRTTEELPSITARNVGEAAQQGDELALDVYRTVGRKLGKALAVLVDLLNPEKIVIGSIYARQQDILEPYVMETLKSEALPMSLQACRIVPAGLNENVGDLASLSVALMALESDIKFNPIFE